MNPASPESPAPAPAKARIVNPPAKGPVDRFIRRFGEVSHTLLLLALYAVAAMAYGLALAPALWFLQLCWSSTGALDAWLKWPLFGIACGLGRESTALISTVLALIVFALVPRSSSTTGS